MDTQKASVPARRRAPRNGGVVNEVAATLAAVGVHAVPDGHEEAMAAQEAAASGSEVRMVP